VRIGRKGFFIKDPVSGNMIDTEGLLIWTVSIAIHRNKQVWGPDVDEFKPERFLPENADKLPPNAWRPFEKGPRNCIGQELALVEMKVVLAMTLREFDVRAAYDELGSLMQDGSLWADEPNFRKGPQEVFGERMHQILLAAGKPSEVSCPLYELRVRLMLTFHLYLYRACQLELLGGRCKQSKRDENEQEIKVGKIKRSVFRSLHGERT
jgi:hypothetical protein